ncbi:MAG: DNA internalization-related competence protein ComEC/Rec2 [Alcanivoracaceae bacterium]|nr:DNA internalization-related competence protein ComEC/Rec2 [Alcanivoracaceae bacterium]
MIALCFGQAWCWGLAALLWLYGGWSAGWRRALCYVPLMMVLALYTQSQLDQALGARLPHALTGEEMQFQARVQALPTRLKLASRGSAFGSGSKPEIEQVRFMVEAQSLDQRWPGRHKLILVWYGEDTSVVQPGALLHLHVRLRAIHGQVNEGGFDAERHALARGIVARGTVRSLTRLAQGEGIDLWRDQLATRIAQRVAHYPQAAALLPALVAGDRRGLSGDHWSVLQSTGTAHLVAISGLHISLVAGLVWWLGRWLISGFLAGSAGRVTAQRLAAWPALLAAVGYAALAGFSLPTQRALLMTVLAMLLLLVGRPRSPWDNLLLVVLLVTIPAPLAWLDSSFWLSFGAVALLLLVHSAGHGGLVRLQLTLTLVFGVLAGQLFGLWSLSALPANLLSVPLYSFLLVPIALLGALLDSSVLMGMAAWLASVSWDLLCWLAPWPSLPLPASWLAGLLLALLLLRLLLPALPGPRWLLLGCLLPWCWPKDLRPAMGEVELVVFDVGQGQMSALRTRNHLLLFDLGPGWQDGNAASRTLIPWLRRHRRQADLVFVSHGHQDHAGGAALFDGRRYHGRLFAGEPQSLPGSQACLRGQRWQFDQVVVEVLWPPAGMPLLHSNNRSCVVKVSAANQRVLLTGDIGRQVEYWLAQHDDLQADVLQVPHHGSRSSSSYTLLRAVRPSHAFISAGYANAFGHPATEIVQRYRQAQIELLNTADSGMLIYGRTGTLSPLRWRQVSAFPWRAGEPVVE